MAAAVEDAPGVALPLVGDNKVVSEWCGPIGPDYAALPLVVLADINHNRATVAIYARSLCEASANYPGAGGHVLRTGYWSPMPGSALVLCVRQIMMMTRASASTRS
jgi:hypothetical protein